MYKVVDKDNEVIVEKARTLQELHDELVAVFWYDCETDEERQELKDNTVQKMCRNTEKRKTLERY